MSQLKRMQCTFSVISSPGSRRRPQRQLPFFLLSTATVTHAIDFFTKFFQVLKAAVHGGEAHVGDFIEIVQLFHRKLADEPRRHFTLAKRTQLLTHMHDSSIERLARYRTFFERLQHAVTQLLLIERLPARIVLHDPRHHELRSFERREPLAALQAFATTPNLLPFARKPRIDDFRFFVDCRRGSTCDGDEVM